MTALLDMLAATLPPFAADADIARRIVERIGLGEIVAPMTVPRAHLTATTR